MGHSGGAVMCLAALAACLWAGACVPAQPIQVVAPPTRAATPTLTPAPLRVDVAGAVRNPGVYTLPPGSIVADAIAAAGGPAEGADLDRLNKAAPLQNGVQVYVPRAGTPSPPAALAPATAPPLRGQTVPLPALGLVDINTASLAELETLPGIGPELGRRIIDGRPYATIEDVSRVAGIGETTFARIKPHITAGP